MENVLQCELENLRAIAGRLGAATASVILLRKRIPGRILYHWPEAAGRNALGTFGTSAVFPGPGPERLAAEDPAAAFLKPLAPCASSFLVSWLGTPEVQTVIAFGFSGNAVPAREVWREASQAIRLMSLAAWCSDEVNFLRAELAAVSERLGQRKLIERAKGVLQARHGWNEQQAYEHLRRLSRQRRTSMGTVAGSLIGSFV